ncbi:MAG: pantoate--beta-alanine ligase [Hyphomicrobium sp.]|nr:pantoate--beta-alanine ligase [Hyphomicrobium sp.]
MSHPSHPSAPRTVRTVKTLRPAIRAFRDAGETIALVPTMGALHEGHLSLVRMAKKKADRAVVSIFVNPTQFAPTEDLSRYPRDETGDLAKLALAGADLVWAPTIAEMYPTGFATEIIPKAAALPLEGQFRPQHFAGVATVCTKLFSQVTPDVAVFGEKDFQQLTVIRQTVRDLDLPLSIIGAPTSREKDGLARSSRNAYLSNDERALAPALHRAIAGVAAVVASGGPVNAALEIAARDLLATGFRSVDYVDVRDAETLAPFDPAKHHAARVLAAAWLGRTRLIDNVPVQTAQGTGKKRANSPT